MKARSRSRSFKPISVALSKPSRSIASKRGFHDQTIIRHWEEFVGKDIAALCQPRQIKSSRGQGATLIVDCLSAYASELTMRSDEIMARLNAAIGFGAIKKIQLHHNHIGFQKALVKSVPPAQEKRKRPPSLVSDLENVQDSELRGALETFSRNFYQKGA